MEDKGIHKPKGHSSSPFFFDSNALSGGKNPRRSYDESRGFVDHIAQSSFRTESAKMNSNSRSDDTVNLASDTAREKIGDLNTRFSSASSSSISLSGSVKSSVAGISENLGKNEGEVSSRPRFFKVRRHLVSHRGKTSVPSGYRHGLDGKIDSGFNPFRSNSGKQPESLISDSGHSHGSKGKLNFGFNPFRLNSEKQHDSSISDVPDRTGSSSIQFRNTYGFGISNDKKIGKKSRSGTVDGGNVVGSSILEDTGRKTQGLSDRFCDRNPFASKALGVTRKSDVQGSVKDAAFVFGAVKSGSSIAGTGGSSNAGGVSEKDGFVFGANRAGGSVSSGDLDLSSGFGGIVGSVLPDEMGKLKIGSGKRENSESRTGNAGTSLKAKDAAFSFNAGIRGNSVSGDILSVFGNTGKKNPASNENLVGGLGGSAVSMPPGEMRKLKISSMSKNSSSRASLDNFPCSASPSISQVNSTDSGIADNNSFLETGDSAFKSKTSDNLIFLAGKVSENGLIFGTSKEKSSNLNNSTGFLGRSMEKSLPDEMKKLNIRNRQGDSGGSFPGPCKSWMSGADNRDPSARESSGHAASSAGRRQKATTTHIPSTRIRRLRNSRSVQGAESAFFSAGKSDKCFSSSTTTDAEVELKNSEDGVFLDLAGDGTTTAAFTFRAVNLGDSFIVDPAPTVEPKGDSKPSVLVGSTSSSTFQPVDNVFVGSSTEKVEDKGEFHFGRTREGLGHADQGILKTEVPSLQKEYDFGLPTKDKLANLHPNIEFSAKGGAAKSVMPKKRRGRLRQSALVSQRAVQNSDSSQKSLEENLESDSPGRYSPMDFSPYQEILAMDEFSRGTSEASDDSVHLGTYHASTDSHCSVSAKPKGDGAPVWELNKEGSKHCFDGSNVGLECSVSVGTGNGSSSEELFFSENGYLDSEMENTSSKDDKKVSKTAAKAKFFNSKIEKLDTSSGEAFSLKSEDINQANFTFAASPRTQDLSLRGKNHYKKKYRMKVPQDTHGSCPNANFHSASPFAQLFPLASSSLQQGPGQDELGCETDKKKNAFVDKRPGFGQEFMPPADCSTDGSNPVPCSASSTPLGIPSICTAFVTSTPVEACEQWRLRGNQAYADGDLSRAEEYYTRGANSVSPSETSGSCARALMLCYSNRAATRMSLGRMREALADCMMAAAINPNFSRVQLRAANCHLSLGEIEDALKHFKKCLQSEKDSISDKKIIVDATDGLQKAQQVAEYMDRSAELLRQRTSNDAVNALRIITEALSISPYSEQLIEMKAEAFLMLHKYEEGIQLCEQTQDSAERNSSSLSSDSQPKYVDDSTCNRSSPAGLWRCRVISKSYFHLGRFEEALGLLQKHEQVDSLADKYGSKISESSEAFVITIRELLRHKAAGNASFQAGRHLEAVEHYTAALTCNTESRPFTAICFCNRAAAYQALGQITDAIADCSLAIALDESYPKAISRRAALHEMIRDYGQTLNDLHWLISLLEKQIEDKPNQPGMLAKLGSGVNDLRQARLRLAIVEEEAKKGIPLDMYLILGVEPTSSTLDIKKAYRKAALRHHPDKAGQFFTRNENGDDRLWKEIATEVHKDADRLFKMIGEAYAIISDPIKRQRYDKEEDLRNFQKKEVGSSTSQSSADVHSYSFERSNSSNRRQWRDPWKAHGAQHHRRSDASWLDRYS